MRKFLALLVTLSLAASSGFSFVPLTNQQLSLGSYRADATAGMFYDELDIISAQPVELLDFPGNRLYTTFGNVRRPQPVSNPLGSAGYNPILSYRGANGPSYGAFDNTFTFGLSGNPLTYFGLTKTRSGLVFQNSGSKNSYFNLDNNLNTGLNPTVTGLDSEGVWNDQIPLNVDGSVDGSIDRVTSFDSNLRNYSNNSTNQWNAGIAFQDLLLKGGAVGFSINRLSNYNVRKTGGTKSYTVGYLSDAGMPAGYTTGTRAGDSYTLTYGENNADQNSADLTDLLAQGRFNLRKNLRMYVGGGIRLQNNYNPGNANYVNGYLNNGISISGSNDRLIGTTVVYDQVSAVRNPNTNNIGGAGINSILDYNVFSNAAGDYTTGGNLYIPQWRGGVNAPAITSFSDDRKGLGPLVRAEAIWGLQDIDVTGVFNLSYVTAKLDANIVERDYINTRTYLTATQLDNWVQRDFTQETDQSGDVAISNMDLGVKFDLLKMKSLRVAFGAFLTSIYEVTDYTQRINSTEITSYDDGAAGNTAWNLTSRPRTNNEGEWRQTVSAETTNKDEVTTTQYSVPVGFEVPLSQKWTFRAGTTYSMAKIKTVARTTGGSVTTVTTETPAGAAATTTTSIGAPAGDYLNDSTTYTEAHQVTYRYGIQWDALDNLTIACNAFLDTNPNNAPAGTKASIFDLDTYRLLAIQAVFKF